MRASSPDVAAADPAPAVAEWMRERLALEAALADRESSQTLERTQVRAVGAARRAAAYLLGTTCGLKRAEIGEYVGRTEQTVSEFTARACESLDNDGPV